MERLFKTTRTIERLRSGPLGPSLQQLVEHFLSQGYFAGTGCRWRLRIALRLVAWLKRSRVAMKDVTPAHIERFITRYCTVKQGDAKTIRVFSDILIANGIIPKQPPALKTAQEKVLDEFTTYLRQQRALAASTISSLRGRIHAFLTYRFAGGSIDLAKIQPCELIDFVRHEAARNCPGSAKNTTAALRSFLRFAGILAVSLIGT